MPHAPRSSASCGKVPTTLSAWTPLSHPLFNSKVFEDRRLLLAKWFDRWSDRQRRVVLQDCVLSCSPQQLLFLNLSVSRRLPLQAADFTCLLPRALCLYLFSFLDPRSLCRCAQVSWHWKSIVELDQLWMPKCVRLSWCISFCPSPFEQGVWKRHYIQTVQELRVASLQQRSVAPPAVSSGHEAPSEVILPREKHAASSALKPGGVSRKKTAPPPWRDSDRHPKDTLRFNYLDNLGTTGQALKTKVNISASTCCSDAWQADDVGRRTVSEAKYKLRKAKSLMFLSSDCRHQHPPPPPPPPLPLYETQSRPSWAARSYDHLVTKETARSMLHGTMWNAGVRPGPVRSAVPRLSLQVLSASQRSQRSAPSTPLFEALPWTAPASHT